MEVGGGSFGMARATLAANSGALDNRWAFHGRFSGMRSDGYRDGASSAANSAFASAGYFGDRDLLKFTFTTGLERNGQSYTPVPESELRLDPRTNPTAGVGDKYRESFATLSWTRFLSPNASAGITGYGFTTRGFYDYPVRHRCSRTSLQLGVALGGRHRRGPFAEWPADDRRRRSRHGLLEGTRVRRAGRPGVSRLTRTPASRPKRVRSPRPATRLVRRRCSATCRCALRSSSTSQLKVMDSTTRASAGAS